MTSGNFLDKEINAEDWQRAADVASTYHQYVVAAEAYHFAVWKAKTRYSEATR